MTYKVFQEYGEAGCSLLIEGSARNGQQGWHQDGFPSPEEAARVALETIDAHPEYYGARVLHMASAPTTDEKWSYESLGDALDVIDERYMSEVSQAPKTGQYIWTGDPPRPTDVASYEIWRKMREEKAALYAQSGWTEDEWEQELDRRLDAKLLAEAGRRKTLRVDKMIVNVVALEGAFADVARGQVSRTSGPLNVWSKPEYDGKPLRGYLLVDGHHRLVEQLLRGPTEPFTWNEVEVRTVGSGYSDYWWTPEPEDRFVFTKSRYGGLEAIIPRERLERVSAQLARSMSA